MFDICIKFCFFEVVDIVWFVGGLKLVFGGVIVFVNWLLICGVIGCGWNGEEVGILMIDWGEEGMIDMGCMEGLFMICVGCVK